MKRVICVWLDEITLVSENVNGDLLCHKGIVMTIYCARSLVSYFISVSQAKFA